MKTITPTISPEQRRALLVARQLRRARTAVAVTESVLALHATDPATVYLSVAARLADPDHARIENQLYDRTRLLRMTAMRGTLFVAPTALAPVLHASLGREYAQARMRILVRHLESEGIGTDWITGATSALLDALTELGTATTAELTSAVAGSDRTFATTTRTRSSLASWLLFILAAEGRIVRADRKGAWTNIQHTWAIAPEFPPLPTEQARAELARHWLRTFGPGTAADLKWWTGWKVTETRKALAAVGTIPVNLDGTTGFALPEHLDEIPEPEPVAAVLPGLDPTPMGWRHRDFYLDPAHIPALFDGRGNIGPTLWWRGRIVGGWAQRRDGTIAWHLLTDPGLTARTAIATEIDRLTTYLGHRRFTVAYRNPLERTLSA
ncbi:winged helix DNA-binding domain-containing protein [Nocardia arthritidis]|uniref:Winged helix DNA-binding domain-containing protein n=1 Tax=Nocardia arthritidis TaxID=228602 RepID=A0A6G9YAF6_9NOCA|nr:winged helix DNA-binding domain-containing protein [Nocardia arthritidis]QIS10100.1 winged helix DNA-binding domain-containing protein [Nocardia arthritidis]